MLLLLASVHCRAQEAALLKVVLNSVDRGEYVVQLTEDGDVLFPADALSAMGIIASVDESADINGLVSLRSLSPDIAFAIQQDEASLLLTVNPAMLAAQTVDYRRKKRSGVLYPTDSSVFLNYALEISGPELSFAVPLELGARSGPFLLLSGARAAVGETMTFARNLTSLYLDDRAGHVRAILGDFVASSGGMGLGGSGIFGGVSFAKNYALDPYFIKGPNIVIRELIATPSTVKMYLNEMQMSNMLKLAPGVMELSHLPLLSGANTFALLITDADGTLKKIEIPYYQSTDLLAPGIDEYSCGAGFKRLDLGSESFLYGEPFFLGFYRMGIADWLTGGCRAELGQMMANAGATAALTVGLWGELGASLAMSYDHGVPGYAGLLSYSYQSRPFGVSLSAKCLSDGYATVSSADETEKTRFEGNVVLALKLGDFGSLSAGASHTLYYDAPERTAFTLAYSTQLWEDVQLRAHLMGLFENGGFEYQGSIGARFLIGEASARLSLTSDESSVGLAASIQKNPPRGNGIGYSVEVQDSIDHEGGQVFDGKASFTARGGYGVYSASASYTGDDGDLDFTLGAAGSIVFVDNCLRLAPPVNDSFALVKVGDLAGVRVKYSNQYVARTDVSGRAIVTGLASFNENEISIEQADIPMEYSSGFTRAFVSPPYRGAGVVDFKTVKFQALTGRLFVIENGKRSPATYMLLELTVEGQAMSGIVGKDGEFYLEKVPAGTYRARLTKGKKTGELDLVVPSSKETIVDVGEIDCEIK